MLSQMESITSLSSLALSSTRSSMIRSARFSAIFTGSNSSDAEFAYTNSSLCLCLLRYSCLPSSMFLTLSAESFGRSNLLSATRRTAWSGPTIKCLGSSLADEDVPSSVLPAPSASSGGRIAPTDFGEDAACRSSRLGPAKILCLGLEIITLSSSCTSAALMALLPSFLAFCRSARCLEMSISFRLVSSMKARMASPWAPWVEGLASSTAATGPPICFCSSLCTACIRSPRR
mmetsp:Transcript_6361/g.22737  ORF Transcript_6361/g.22737 Transcript_6361/m.22737 type:complete len:232 (+) Transcript_6361:54-749(+)